jgi:hypothetical protein
MRAAAVLALGAWAAALPASGEPCVRSLDPLRAEVETRYGYVRRPTGPAERAEKRALARCRRLLDRRTGTFRKDARAAAGAAATLLGQYPSDAGIAALLSSGLDGLRDALALEGEDLLLTGSALPAGEGRDAAEAGAAAAASLLAASGGAADAAARALALEGAADALRAGYRGALEGPDRRLRRTCGDGMLVREGGALLWRADGATAVVSRAGRTLRLEGVRARRPAEDSSLVLEVSNFFGVGTYQMAFGSGAWREGAFVHHGIVEAGTLTVTAYDGNLGRIEGTFAFTARGCLFRCAAVEVTGGSFLFRHATIL